VFIEIQTQDGVADAYLARPAADGPHPGVLFFMDAIGLRPRLEEMADRLAGHGYVVLVPNLFYRHGRAPVVEDLPDLLKPENRPKMMEVMRGFLNSLTPEAAMRDTAAYLEHLATVSTGPFGATGYCMGGRLAVRAAAEFADRFAAIASFHAGGLATDAPDSPHAHADRIRAELYVAHADNDASMPPEQQERLEKALAEAGVRHRCELYAGTTHGFTMSDTAAHNADAEQRHWTNLLELFGRTLR
jgi:carboxymethylenebutenolidase